MYICLECKEIFEHPEHFTETHNLECPPYEEFDGCPRCGGAFAVSVECNLCGDYIDDKYISIDISSIDIQTTSKLIVCKSCYEEEDLER